jgi:hypothetical protein
MAGEFRAASVAGGSFLRGEAVCGNSIRSSSEFLGGFVRITCSGFRDTIPDSGA